jgi:Uncharacterized conserved protein
MKHVYAAVFSLEPKTKETYNVWFPDISGCATFGNGLIEAVEMAKDALTGMLWSKEEDGEKIPKPTPMNEIEVNDGDFVNLITAETDEYRKVMNKSVRKNVTLPKWLDQEATEANINFSKVLQEALISKLEAVN